MSAVLVTGGAGFIGSNLVDALASSDDSEPGAPGAGADNGDPAHECTGQMLTRLSVL